MNPGKQEHRQSARKNNDEDYSSSLLTILFIKHVPGGDDAFLTLLASIRVQKVSKDHEESRGSDVSAGFILLDQTGERNEEKHRPGHTGFSPHFQINVANTRIQAGTHKIIVEEVTRHTVMFAHNAANDIDECSHSEAPDNGDLGKYTMSVHPDSKSQI